MSFSSCDIGPISLGDRAIDAAKFQSRSKPMMTLATANLTERAMLVNLSISQWTAVKNDKRVTREVAQQHSSQENMGRYNKSLVAKTALETLKKLAGEARSEHYKRTLPWRDGGDRILSSVGYFDYSQSMREKMRAFETAKDEFLMNYQTFVDDARARLNGLFNAADHPSASAIREKFSFGFEFFPMPTADDFRVNLGDAETAKIRAEIEAQADAMLNKAMSDVWARLRDVVSRMSERLKAYALEESSGKIQNPFRDTLVTNITDLLAILPSLNLTNDPNIASFAREIESNLTRYTPDQLRNSAVTRADVATRADEILSKMSAFVA